MCLCDPTQCSRKFPLYCCVRCQWLVSLAFIFPLRVRSVQPLFFRLPVNYWLLSSHGHIRLSFLPHTCGSVPQSPTSRLPDWLDSRDSLWLQFAYWNYQCDHRSNPISCLLIEFSKVDMRAHVFWIPREVLFIFCMHLYKIICTQHQKIGGVSFL